MNGKSRALRLVFGSDDLPRSDSALAGTSRPARAQRMRSAAALAGALGVLLASLPAIALPVNLLANGSFETPALTPGSDLLTVPVGDTTITGWTVTGPAGSDVVVIEELYDLSDAAGIDFAAADGVQWIDMTGSGANSTEGLSQTVSLAPGTYSLSFYIGNVVAAAANLGTQSTVALFLNSVFTQSFTNVGSGGAGINWQQFSHTFDASGSTNIEFRNADGASDHLSGLDNVVLVAVPEPEIHAMLLAGLGLLSCAARYRKHKAA